MRRPLTAIFLAVAVAIAACSNAPDPGNLAAFCRLLESGSGLTSTATAADLDLLVNVAPPAIRETIVVLQDRARDFDELMLEQPPDLEALFNARFDAIAEAEQNVLDNYAETSCGIVVARPTSTRWNNYLRDNHAGETWIGLISADFDVVSEKIHTASVAFAVEPDPIELVEEACQAVSGFLGSEGAEPGRVLVLIGTVVALEYDTPGGLCRLP